MRLQFRVDGSQTLDFRREMKRAKKVSKRVRKKAAPRAKAKRATAGEWVEKLVKVQARLRAPDGCPWDREQTHMTFRTYLIEEADEGVEALGSGDRWEIG